MNGSNTYSTHSRTNLTIDKSGYLYIYVSNETPNIDVFFDNLQVTHVRGPLLEETHYYPFGLIQAGIFSKAINFGEPENKHLFTSQLLDDDLGMNLYQMRFRNHDPQIGRFIQIDPLADKYVHNSTYAYAENDVMRAIDLEGLEKLIITDEKVKGYVTKITAERVVRGGQLLNNNIKLNDSKGNPIPIDKDVLRLQNNVKVNGKIKYDDQTTGTTAGERMIMKEGITQTATVGKDGVSENQMEIKENEKVVGLGDVFNQEGDTYIRSEGYVSGRTTSVGDLLNAEIGVVRQIDELKDVAGNIDTKNLMITLIGGVGSSGDLNKIKGTLQKSYNDATITVVESKNFKPIGSNKINFNMTVYAVTQ